MKKETTKKEGEIKPETEAKVQGSIEMEKEPKTKKKVVVKTKKDSKELKPEEKVLIMACLNPDIAQFHLCFFHIQSLLCEHKP